MAKKSNQQEDAPEVMFIEAVGMQGSGWIQDDTIGTANPIELSWPSRFYIPRTGYRKALKDPDNPKSWYNEPIRHIKNSPLISEAEHRQHGITPSPDHSEDLIYLEKGCGFFVREGGNIGTYDFLKESYYNESNPDRVASATALYRVIKLEEKNEEDFELEMQAADAVKFVGTLYEKKGNQYIYKQDAIDAICTMFQIFADTPSGKIIAIQRIAKQRPDFFLKRVEKMQQTVVTEITHAIELNVIEFVENDVMYKGKNEMIVSLGTAKLKQHQKIESFSQWLQTEDGNPALTKLRTEIELAREEAISKQ